MGKLVVDANILISVIIRGRARELLLRLRKTTLFLTTELNIREVLQSLPAIARKRGIKLELLYDALSVLPLERFSSKHYESKMEEARKRIGKRDPTDIDLLALALKEGAPVWSQDKDFDECGVELFTTESLLRKNGEIGRSHPKTALGSEILDFEPNRSSLRRAYSVGVCKPKSAKVQAESRFWDGF